MGIAVSERAADDRVVHHDVRRGEVLTV